MISTNSIVKFSSEDAIKRAYDSKKISKNTTNLNEYYGIVRDSYKSGYYVEFFNHSSNSLDIAFYEESDLQRCGGLYDLIKNSVCCTQTKAKVQAAKKKDVSNKKDISFDEIKKPLPQAPNENFKSYKCVDENSDPSTLSKEDLKGKRVLFTGKFLFYKNTDNFKDTLSENGIIYQPNVTSKLDILVVGSKGNVGRINKARNVRALIITEYELTKILSR